MIFRFSALIMCFVDGNRGASVSHGRRETRGGVLGEDLCRAGSLRLQGPRGAGAEGSETCFGQPRHVQGNEIAGGKDLNRSRARGCGAWLHFNLDLAVSAHTQNWELARVATVKMPCEET